MLKSLHELNAVSCVKENQELKLNKVVLFSDQRWFPSQWHRWRVPTEEGLVPRQRLVEQWLCGRQLSSHLGKVNIGEGKGFVTVSSLSMAKYHFDSILYCSRSSSIASALGSSSRLSVNEVDGQLSHLHASGQVLDNSPLKSSFELERPLHSPWNCSFFLSVFNLAKEEKPPQ